MSFPSTKNKEEFKKFKNVLTQLIRKAKARYFEKSFVEARGDQKHTWRLINSLLGRSQKSSFPNEMLRGDGTFSSDNQEIVNLLNTHFVSIGEKTANACHVSPNNNNNDLFKDHMLPPSDKSMFLSPVTEIELKLIISKMKNGSSEALDGSSSNLVKEILPVISPVLCHIINLIFVTVVYPSTFKSARIVALHKGDDPRIPANYRPISILSAFSKVVERALYNRIYSFFEKFDYISKLQFGFRKEHCTDHPMAIIVQHISYCLDRDETPATIFLDIQKAFDSISHEILLYIFRMLVFVVIPLGYLNRIFMGGSRYLYIMMLDLILYSSQIRLVFPRDPYKDLCFS